MRTIKQRFRHGAETPARVLVAWGVSANAVTLCGFLLSCAVGVVLAGGALPLGGMLFLVVSSTDFLDGAVARLSGRAGPFGAFLDSVLDRLSEAAPLVGLGYWFAAQQQPIPTLLAALALTTSFSVSYARARAEGLGYECEVGVLQRPERIVLLGCGLIAAAFDVRLTWLALAGLALVSGVTTLQRIMHVSRLVARSQAAAAEPPPGQ